MSLESELNINAKEAAAIAGFFKKADAAFLENRESLTPFIGGGYQEKFGDLNFAVLEQVFRQNNFNTYFLAVPTKMVEPTNPHIIVADVNQLLKDNIVKKPFVAIAYPGLEEIINAAQLHGFPYDSHSNLKDLKNAGIYSPRPGSHLAQKLRYPKHRNPSRFN